DDSATVVWQADYEPFGNATVNPASTVVNNLRAPGQYFDAETGLHYNWQRYYDPQTGRYLTPDPIGLNGGINLYSYATQNPINYIDADGKLATTIVGIIAGAYTGALSGIESGNMFSAIAGGTAGAIVGGIVGTFVPHMSGVAGGVIGGAISGAFGGAAGSAFGKYLDPCSSSEDVLIAAGNGMANGMIVGAAGGGLSSAAIAAGVPEVAAATASNLSTSPVSWGLDHVNYNNFSVSR
ncbi:MAG: hypothetical protein KQH63_21145, partial [Desulfobulbaceae bacterium]|nr:hypothetical protein [Desulfobulbaceae bacterium]